MTRFSSPERRAQRRASRLKYSFLNFIFAVFVVWTIFNFYVASIFTPDHLHNSSHDQNLNENGEEKTSTTVSTKLGAGGNEKPKTVAYAVSFIKCGDKQTSSAGLVDASLVLRHSIHQISSRNPASKSKYDYKMYAIVHRQAEQCSTKLKDVGFEILVVDPPLDTKDIRGDVLRKKIHKEWCCGSDEFVKLFAYTLPEDIIVHLDIDYAFYKPMDHLFDAILYDKNSEEGKKARHMLELERPGERLPDKIGAFITRDWGQVAPG